MTEIYYYLLNLIYKNNGITANQISVIAEKGYTYCIRLLRELTEKGLIVKKRFEIEKYTGTSPIMFFMTSKGLIQFVDHYGREYTDEFLKKEARRLNKRARTKSIFLKHLWVINEVYTMLEAHCRKYSNIKIVNFDSTGSIKFRIRDPFYTANVITVVPDAYLQLRINDKDKYYFIEIDMGTEAITSKSDRIRKPSKIEKKIRGYKQAYREGKFLEIFGKNTAIVKIQDYPFRVLFITSSVKETTHRNSLLKATINEEGGDQFLFSTLNDFLKDPFGKNFISGSEYQKVLARFNSVYRQNIFFGNSFKQRDNYIKELATLYNML